MPDNAHIQCPGDASISGHPCRVLQVGPDCITVQGADLPDQGEFRQSFVACTGPELHGAFADFWNQLWQRDQGPASRDPEAWPHFQSLLQSYGIPAVTLNLDPFDAKLWRKAVQRMPKCKATGVCGWAPGDLKLLPLEAWKYFAPSSGKPLRGGSRPTFYVLRCPFLPKLRSPLPSNKADPSRSFRHFTEFGPQL